MSHHRASRLSALVIACAIGITGALAPVSAMADELPSPAVVESPTAEPTAEAPAPVDDETAEPVEEDAPAEDAPAEEAPTETKAPAVTDATVEYTGQLTRLSDGASSELESDIQLLRVIGSGLLQVDVSGVELTPSILTTTTRFRLRVPAGVALTGDPTADFDALAAAPAPLVVVGTAAAPATKSVLNSTTITAATHKVFAVLVTPSNVAGTVVAPNQTISAVQQSVTNSDTYWNKQTAGKARFQLAGTVPWYKSTRPCSDATGLWTEARTKAIAQLGYEDAVNAHLVLFFPSGSGATCGAGGLGTVGGNANYGGYIWVAGTNGVYEQRSLAHELGHNMSLGHSTWADCTSSTPTSTLFGFSGCSLANEYGDVADVMGGAGYAALGGAVSAPHAIRAGLWASGSWANTTAGTTKTYTLKSLTTYSGLRAVVIEDTNGVNYVVEYRDFTGEDADFKTLACPIAGGYPGCGPNGSAQVRVLRLNQDESVNGYFYKGISGDASVLMGRTVGGVKRVGYLAGESFTQPSGLKVQVSSISGDTATIKVTAPATTFKSSYIDVYRTSPNDATSYQVGDQLTMFLDEGWRADSYTFSWLRNGVAISGATKQSYTLVAADYGKAIKARVVAKTGTKTATATDPSSLYSGFGPIGKGVLDGGTVAVDAAEFPLKAVTAGWSTPSTAFAYQWYRNGTAISGATKSSYLPVAADANTNLTVKATGSRSGFTSVSATSANKTVGGVVVATGTPAITGTLKVGQVLTAAGTSYSTPAPSSAIASPLRLHQWYRNGTAISGATASTYLLTAADYGTKITVKVTGGTTAYVPVAQTSAATAAVGKGVIAGSLAIPTVAKAVAGTKITLTASLPSGSVTESGTKSAFQWYRGTAAIAGATKSSYVLTSSDVGKQIKVRVTVTKSTYTTVVLYSTAPTYSVDPAGPVTVSGTVAVNSNLTAVNPGWTAGGSAVTPTLKYQWYRDGVAIIGATGATFLLTAPDYAKKLTVKVTASLAGFQSRSATSAATVAVAKGTFGGTRAVPTVAKSVATTASGETITLTATAAAGAATTLAPQTAATQTWQWYRDATAITGATKASYVLTASDYGKQVSVTAVYSKSTFTTVKLSSTPINYSVLTTGATPAKPVIAGAATVGLGTTLSATGRTYDKSAVVSYQWFAAGAAIPTATAGTFVPTTAELGKTISVKVTARASGYLPAVATSASTLKVGTNVFPDATNHPDVTSAASGTKVKLTAHPGVVATGGVAHAYQWFRGSAAIASATASTYTLTSADYNKQIWVRVTTTKSTYTAVINDSTPYNYSLVAAGLPTISSTTPAVGNTLTVTPPSYNLSGATFAYQWYADGVAVAGKTASTLVVTSGLKGKAITVKVVASLPLYLSSTTTSAKTAKVVL